MDIRPISSEVRAAYTATVAASRPERPPRRETQKAAALHNTGDLTGRSVQYRVDASVNRVVVSVVDQDTGEVLRQIPSAEAIALMKQLDIIMSRDSL